jgi:protein TonB
MSDISRSPWQGWIRAIVIVVALAAGPLVFSSNALAGEGSAATPKVDSPSAAGDNVEATGELQPPVLVSRVTPHYSKKARKAKVQGTVGIKATIDTNGNVVSPEVVRSVPLLDEAALSAVKQWKYRPATRAGRPVEVVLMLDLNFAL